MENRLLVFEIKDKLGNTKKYWLDKLQFEFYKSLRKDSKIKDNLEANKIKERDVKNS